MVKELERLALRSKTFVVGFNIYNNWRFSRRFRVGNAASDHGAVHAGLDLPASLGDIDISYDVFVKCPGFSAEMFHGRSILEAGTGDNFGLALLFLASGANRVVTIDKFYSKRNPEQQRRIYLAMRERLGPEARARFDRAIDLSSGIKTNENVLRYIYGTGIEEADRLLAGDRFDFVISTSSSSRARCRTCRRSTARSRSWTPCSRRGGWMMHKIDLSDQGMFSRDGQHHKPRLEDGVDYGASERALIDAIRPRLLPRYRRLSTEELLTSGIFVLVRKP